jgi:RNA polymerase sigma-70 factor, ECF subfamily
MELFAFDDDYVQRLRDGDPPTEEHFYSYFRPRLQVKLRHVLRAPHDVDDACQDIFMRVLADLRSPGRGVRDARKFGAYVLGFCRFVLLERMNRDKRTEPFDERLHDRESQDDDSETALVTAESKRHVREVLEELPERDREILRAYFFDEEEKDAICARFGVDRGYLRVLLHRALARFREKLDETKTRRTSLRR